MQTKIQSEHYSRKAYIYIRQSSMSQVNNNLESQRLQYQLAQRAQQLGWSDSVIIDHDLGRSGSGTVERPGFSRLLMDVLQKKAGAIFCIEASRLSRNNREWSMLIEQCALMNTLIIDLDGIYDANNLSDRVFLGMKGTMIEYELGILRQRAQSAILQKAKRGQYYNNLATGYILTDDKFCEINPDQRIQDAYYLVFKKFRELGAATQVVSWFQTEKIEIPSKDKKGKIIWKLPTMSTITKILKNPIYAGAYAYGRRETQTRIIDGTPRKFEQRKSTIDQCKILIKDHHQGYISWDEYLVNQKRLSENINKTGDPTIKTAVKKGAALLAGLLRCGRCSNKLRISYSGSQPGKSRYFCQGQTNIAKSKRCMSFSGNRLEQLVSEEIFRVVQPAAIDAADQAERLLQQSYQDKHHSIYNLIKQAEYKANLYEEQFNLVDPKNRLVALNLETRWNKTLQKVELLKQQLEHEKKQYQAITSQQRKALYTLKQDLSLIWNDPQTDIRLKKRIIQTLIKEIVVDIKNNFLIANIHWTGGTHTNYQIKCCTRKYLPHQNQVDIEKVIKQLEKIVPDKEIARILNLSNIKTESQEDWNSIHVLNFRAQYNIPDFDAVCYKEKGYVNLKQAAAILGTFPTTVKRLIKAGILKAHQVIKYAPWLIDKDQLTNKNVLKVVQNLKHGQKNSLIKNQQAFDL